MNINMNSNPFQGSTVNQKVSQQKSSPALDKFLTPEEQEQQRRQRQEFFKTKNFVNERLLGRNANAQRKKKDRKDNKLAETANAPQQPQNIQQKMYQLSEQKHEVNALKKQLASTNDPGIQQKLKEMYGAKLQSSSNLENEVSLLYRDPGGGFVGSEGRIDFIANFVAIG